MSISASDLSFAQHTRFATSPWLVWIAVGLLLGCGPSWLVASPWLALGATAVACWALLQSDVSALLRRCSLLLAVTTLAALIRPDQVIPEGDTSPRLVLAAGVADGVWHGRWGQTIWLEQVVAVDSESGDLPPGLLVRITDPAAVYPGDLVHVGGRLEGGFDHRGRWRTQLSASMVAVTPRSAGGRGWAWQAVGAVAGDQVLAGSLLLGRGASPARQYFRQAGVLHLLAVSGLHLGIAMGVVWLVLGATGAPWSVRQLAAMALGAGYWWLTGGGEATTRALVMLLAVGAMTLARRRPHPLAAWSLAVVVLIMLDPARAAGLGFQLSVLAVAGIMTLGRELVQIRRRYCPLQPWPLDRPSWRVCLACARGSIDGLVVGLAATTAVAPLLAASFQTATPWAPLATVVATPLVALVLIIGLPYLVCVGLWSTGPWQGLAWAIERCLSAMIELTTWLAALPGSLALVELPPWPLVVLWPALFCPLRDAVDAGLRLLAVVFAWAWLIG